MFTTQLDRAAVSAASLVDNSILPSKGGWYDQTLSFHVVAGMAIRWKRHYEEEQRKRAMRKHGS